MGCIAMIYADNAATTKLDLNAYEAMQPYLLDEYANASQPYSFSREAKSALNEARKEIASCINAKPEEIYFTSGGTESDNWVIKGCLDQGERTGIVTSEFEHHAILHACERVEKLGTSVKYLHPSKDGFITPGNLERSIPNSTKLVSIMMVNNEIGTIQPIKELCSIAHENGALFHTDAVQAVGHIQVDVKDLGIDMLSASAHKFNGPKGIGFLYIKKGTHLTPYADGGAQEFQMRAGTENIASIVGMATALVKNLNDISMIQQRLRRLEEIIIGKLKEANVDFIRNGSEPHIPGNLSLSFKGKDGEMLLHRLDLMGIMVSTGSACDSKNTEITHVLKAIDLDEKYALGTIRISLGKDNTEEEAAQIVEALLKILG